MGRTLPTFNTYLEQEMEAWGTYRRALRREDKDVLDHLFVLAKRHMAEAANAARPIPFDTLVMSILLEQQKELGQLRAAIKRVVEEKASTDYADFTD